MLRLLRLSNRQKRTCLGQRDVRCEIDVLPSRQSHPFLSRTHFCSLISRNRVILNSSLTSSHLSFTTTHIVSLSISHRRSHQNVDENVGGEDEFLSRSLSLLLCESSSLDVESSFKSHIPPPLCNSRYYSKYLLLCLPQSRKAAHPASIQINLHSSSLGEEIGCLP